jgi:hypothetical protein
MHFYILIPLAPSMLGLVSSITFKEKTVRAPHLHNGFNVSNFVFICNWSKVSLCFLGVKGAMHKV